MKKSCYPTESKDNIFGETLNTISVWVVQTLGCIAQQVGWPVAN